MADAAHAAYIDEVEVGHRSAGRARIALGVRDVGEQSRRLEEAGIAVVAPPTPTPFGTTNARFELSDGIQLTLFG